MKNESKSLKREVCRYVKIMGASLFYSAGVSFFLEPAGLITGGVTGVAMILHILSGAKVGTLLLLINIPILLLSVILFGWRFTVATLYCTALCSVGTNVFSVLLTEGLTKDPFVAGVLGGACIAIGLGIAFKNRATTGGTDIIVKSLRKRFPYMKTGVLVLLIDLAILCVAAFVLHDLEHVVYGGVSVVVTSYMLDLYLYGADEAKMMIIISESYESIADRMLKEMKIGATYLYGRGAYLDRGKEIILCVMKKQNAVKAEEIIRQEDPYAFVIISSANEIYGLGYKNIRSEKV